jgi:hypothetical protein
MKLSETDKRKYLVNIDEKSYLQQASDYLKELFSSKVEIFSADEKNIYDPVNKTRLAVPLRPAIYIV